MFSFIKNIFKIPHQEDLQKLYPHKKMFFYGTQYGGWYVPKSMKLTSNDVCYFMGAGEDISFDCAIAMNYPCKIHIFDPTPRAVAHFTGLHEAVLAERSFPINNTCKNYTLTKEALKRITFHPWGVAEKDGELQFYLPQNPEHVSCSIVNLQKTSDSFTAKCYTVASLMRTLNHDNIAFMKMDIEGAEHGTIKQMLEDGIKPRLLSIEFDELHTPLDEHSHSRVAGTVERLQKHDYTLIFKDSFNYTFFIE